MRAALVIAGVELRRVAGDRIALFFIAVLPIAIMTIIGSTFGGEDGEVPLGVVDEDGTVESRALVDELEGTPLLVVERFDSRRDMAQEIRNDAVSSGLVVPEGFGAGLDAGEPVDVELVTDPVRPVNGTVRAVVDGVLADAGAPMAAARLAAELAGGDVDEHLAAARALQADAPRVEVQRASTGDGEGDPNPYGYTVPANLVLFVFVSSLAIGGVLVESRRLGVVDRIRAGPVSTAAVVGGFALSRVAFGVLQSLLLLGIGALVFGVDVGDPLGALTLVVLFAVVAAGVGLVVGAGASNVQQAQAIGIPIGIALGMLGGTMWPLEIVGPTMRAIGHVVPQAWAMDGWSELVLDGEPARAIAGEALVLAAYAAAALVLGTALLHRTLTR